jgi:proteasome lid subunit RPN8/RPN11
MTSEIKRDKSNFNDGKIIISKEAYRNIITHVLRFGNNALENSVEVVGICIGKIAPNEKDILLVNAIPITHGKEISLGFSNEDFATFEKIEERFKSQGLSIVGWYNSHPGWGLFFSDMAIKNQRHFQTEQSPNSFSIVFDHTLMGNDGNLGFEIYSLDNYEDLTSKEYHTVEFELELPKTLEYFKWVQKFVEDTQKKIPVFIKEFNELLEPTPSNLQEIPLPEKLEQEKLKKKEDPDIIPIVSGIQEGGAKFADSFMETFTSQLSNWAKDISSGSLDGAEQILISLEQMKEKISSGIPKAEKWFKLNLDEVVANFKKSISNYVDIRMETQKEIVEQARISKDDTIKEIKLFIENNFNNLINEIESKSKSLQDKVSNITETKNHQKEIIKNSSEKMAEVNNLANSITDEIKQLATTTTVPFEQDLIKEIENVNNLLENLKNNYVNANEKLEKLKKSVETLKEF